MNRIASIGLAAIIGLGLIGCGGDGDGLINQPNPRVRLANLMPGINNAMARVGSDTISETIAFGTVSDFAITPNGNKDLTVGDSTFDNLATLSDQLFELNRRYTAVAYGTTPRTIILLEDDESGVSNDDVAIRAVHAAQGAANVDVYISAPGDPLPAAPAMNALAPGTASDYSITDVGGTNTYRIRVFADGDTTTALVDQTIAIDPGERVAVIVYADSGQASGFNALVFQESID